MHSTHSRRPSHRATTSGGTRELEERRCFRGGDRALGQHGCGPFVTASGMRLVLPLEGSGSAASPALELAASPALELSCDGDMGCDELAAAALRKHEGRL